MAGVVGGKAIASTGAHSTITQHTSGQVHTAGLFILTKPLTPPASAVQANPSCTNSEQTTQQLSSGLHLLVPIDRHRL
jgi:hypothetical protein